ncbi:hypothetical protein J6590_003368 [Homalodisca vitripennis]|nr:hypothetical protein J6590_003368 [Homalodisca vitripennis]
MRVLCRDFSSDRLRSSSTNKSFNNDIWPYVSSLEVETPSCRHPLVGIWELTKSSHLAEREANSVTDSSRAEETGGDNTSSCLGFQKNFGSAARDPHGIKQITVGPPHGIKQITMFIRENVECLDSSFTTTTTIKESRLHVHLKKSKRINKKDVPNELLASSRHQRHLDHK